MRGRGLAACTATAGGDGAGRDGGSGLGGGGSGGIYSGGGRFGRVGGGAVVCYGLPEVKVFDVRCRCRCGGGYGFHEDGVEVAGERVGFCVVGLCEDGGGGEEGEEEERYYCWLHGV